MVIRALTRSSPDSTLATSSPRGARCNACRLTKYARPSSPNDTEGIVSAAKSLIVILLLATTIAAAEEKEKAMLKVTSFPTGASVSVDGHGTGKVTPMSMSLPVGNHSVTVAIAGSGWNPDTRTVGVTEGKNDLSVTLLPS